MKYTKICYAGLCAALLTLPLLASAGPGHNVENRLDQRGDRIENRLDQRGDRIDDKLDRRGDRINDRLDRKSDRAAALGLDVPHVWTDGEIALKADWTDVATESMPDWTAGEIVSTGAQTVVVSVCNTV
ncbi:MAG: hypothetical protein GXP18_12580 [Gammaproteobacteria bacterium]|nr:hypothetical protein [Gammaproteobacteria bacterium]